MAERVRRHRISTVLNLEHQDVVRQMRSVAAFLGGLFDVDRALWFPALVVVDEAQVFAPAVAGDVPDEARKATLGAMTNLMCRGRKRGLAGVIATQRLAKLAKNVAAEASNFLMGRTFLDIDMARAADLLGMERRQAEMFRDLRRGQFMALGPALSRRPLALTIGAVTTVGRAVSSDLLATPPTLGQDATDLLSAAAETGTTSVAVKSRPSLVDRSLVGADVSCIKDPGTEGADAPAVETRAAAEGLGLGDPVETVSAQEVCSPHEAPQPAKGSSDIYASILRDILLDADAPHHSVAVLYQDFLVRCRTHGLSGRGLGLPSFRRRVTLARAGLAEDVRSDPMWARAFTIADQVPEDVRSLFLLLAKAALERAPCPSDAAIAWARGSRSSRRARGVLTYLEDRGVITIREDMHGNRVIAVPDLECETASGSP